MSAGMGAWGRLKWAGAGFVMCAIGVAGAMVASYRSTPAREPSLEGKQTRDGAKAMNLDGRSGVINETQKVPRASARDEVDGARLMALLRGLPEARAAAGTQADRDGLVLTQEIIERELVALGFTVTRERLYWTSYPGLRVIGLDADGAPVLDPKHPVPLAVKPTTDGLALRPALGPVGPWENLIVEIPGTSKPKEIVLIGAHFDAFVQAPGADDNGTGTAALLELARVLKDRPLKRTVRLCFFNLEEVGLVGSRYHALAWDKRRANTTDAAFGETMTLMVSLEMLGYFSDEQGSQRSPISPIAGVFEPPTVGNFIAIASTQPHAGKVKALEAAMKNAEPGLVTFSTSIFPDIGPKKDGAVKTPLLAIERTILRSDHASFLLIGEPGVIVTDTANYRNPHYHKPSDRVETIDVERFVQVVRAMAGAVEAIANEKMLEGSEK